MNRDLGFVALALMTWGVGEGMFYFFQPLYLQQLGADPVQIGSIIGLVGLAMTISYLPAGMLSDRIGRVPLLRLAWILGILSTLLLAFGGSLTVFVAGMVIYGTTAFVTVPLNSYTTAARGRLSVGRTITLISAAFNFGAVVRRTFWTANEFPPGLDFVCDLNRLYLPDPPATGSICYCR